MKRNIAFLSASMVVFAWTHAAAQSSADADPKVRAIARCVAEKDEARHEGVADYSIDLTMMGNEATQFFERTEITAADGMPYDAYRLVSPAEIGKRTTDPSQQLSPEDLNLYASALDETGTALEREMNNSGLPAGMITGAGAASNEEPWASPNPRVMMSSMANFAREASTAQANIDDGRAAAPANMNDMSTFFNAATLAGTENIAGRNASHIRAEEINHTQVTNGQEFTIKNFSLWVDEEECVPLQFRMEGIATIDGQARDIFIERQDLDYRAVPNSSMYESYRQVMRMGGVLSPAEMAQMAEARVQLEEFDQQLAAMPPSQQAMMKKMMGSQMDMMRSMVDTGAFEFETVVRAIRVNEGVQGALGHSAAPFAAAAAAAAVTSGSAGGNSLVQMIQRDLLALGYDPGNTSGELTKETVVAISKYQAVKGMEVTGQATPQLAGILSAAVDAQN